MTKTYHKLRKHNIYRSKQQDQQTIQKLREELRLVRKEYEKKQEKLSSIRDPDYTAEENWIILRYHQQLLLPIIWEQLWILQQELMKEILPKNLIQVV